VNGLFGVGVGGPVGFEEMVVDLFVDNGVGAVGLLGGLGSSPSLQLVKVSCILHQLLCTRFNLLFKNRPQLIPTSQSQINTPIPS
jgi:hypothetical protein